MLELPETFRQTILATFGAAGRAWLAALPAILADCAARWSLQLGPPVPNLSYNYVVSAETSDGLPVMLKLGVPHPELLGEMAALAAYAGRGCVRLLACDPAQGALLLERLQPGLCLTAMVKAGDDERATRLAAGVMRQLWRPLPPAHVFPTTARWADGLVRLRATFGGGVGPFPADLVALAERLFADLLATSAEARLLHGDLHHDNILSATRAPWLAIDPKGLAGEPAYEVGALLRNPWPWLLTAPEPAALLAQRVQVLASELSLDQQRLIGWGVAQAVLSAWWAYEDEAPGWRDGLIVAAWLRAALD